MDSGLFLQLHYDDTDDDVPLQAGAGEPDPAPGVRVRLPRPAAPLQPPPAVPGGPVQVPRDMGH